MYKLSASILHFIDVICFIIILFLFCFLFNITPYFQSEKNQYL